MSRVFVIAEAGVNHNGSLQVARELVAAAARAGADAVKFQAFVADDLATGDVSRAAYQERNTGSSASQLDMLRKLELGEEAHRELKDLATELGIDMISSAFDLRSVEMLARLGLRVWKVPSGEIDDLPYLRAVARHAAAQDVRVLVSTGMAELDEVRAALAVLASGGVDASRIVVLQCTTEYPARLEDANLRAMLTMRDEFGVAIGYSDHTQGIHVPLAAVAMGAVVIEKHFTLDSSQPGPDHAASLEPTDFAEMVERIREIEVAMGDGVKHPAPDELEARKVVRKTIVAARPIGAGEVITEDAIAAKRAVGGVSPMEWDLVIGSRATRDFGRDEAIEL